MDREQIGRIFRSLRIKKGMNQPELIRDIENKTGIKILKSAVSMYENGKRIPETNLLCILADYFGVTTDYLLGRSTIELDFVKEMTDRLFEVFGNLSEEDRKQAIKYMEFMNAAKENEDG